MKATKEAELRVEVAFTTNMHEHFLLGGGGGAGGGLTEMLRRVNALSDCFNGFNQSLRGS